MNSANSMNSEFEQIAQLPSVDADYRFGRPKVYLTAMELARLTLLRSKLGDTRLERGAERIAPCDLLGTPSA